MEVIAQDALPEITDACSLGVYHLKRYWARQALARSGRLQNSPAEWNVEWNQDRTLLYGLGLGLRETLQYLFTASPSLEEFEQWILERNGGEIDAARLARLNAALTGQDSRDEELERAPDVLTAEDLAFWDEHGYVVLHDAVPLENCRAAAQAVWESIGADPADPSTWGGGPQGASIWVPALHHPALRANRQALRVRKAFAQVWKRSDIWITVDFGGFNPPESERWKFPGPYLHWDVSVEPPVPFGVQGILYLSDTAADQGAFRCVPGFHRKLNDWLRSLPPGANPREQDLEALGPVAIAGRAGDLIIWRHELPHGSSPNRATQPRIVQYISADPSTAEMNPVWK